MTAEGIVGEFFALKAESEADVLAMQMGDFYEFFGEDARTVGEELDLKVSERSSGGEMYEMAGVPVDDLTPYLKALVERGYRVAVADQHAVDGGHERRISRVVTPGTLVDPTGDDAQYLAAVVREGDSFGLAFVDITTGRFQVTELSGPDAASRALTELYRFAPTELLPGPDLRGDDAFLDRVRERLDTTLTLHATDAFAPGRATHTVREQFGVNAADSVGLGEQDLAVRAAGAALSYIEETGVGALASVTRLQSYSATDHVTLDATTQRNLELTEPMTGQGVSLFSTIDHTTTSAGGRLLKEWLGRPIRRRGELEARQAAVGALAADAMSRERLRDLLDGAYDLERLASRAVSGSLDAHGMLRVRDTLGLVPELVDAVESSPRLADSPVAEALASVDRDALDALHEALASALAEDPPKTLTEGGLLRPEYDEDLRDLVDRHDEAVEWIDTLAERESEKHGISRLSVDRNKTDGYYIQVAKSEREKVPDHYEGIKTLKNSERYVHPELEERERDILRLEERRGDLEYELFCDLREQVADHATAMQDAGRAVAELDVYASLAVHAVRNDWTKPELTDDDVLSVDAGRHPVVEQSVEFVPNDLHLDRERRFLVVTGPNMSGKSTYMRQAALITLLAQVGSFVPATHARVGLVDGVFTRVGALDELAQGRSTFMVEMQELSNILHSATEESLVILDEVGRGTATYDGISIAWAATEYLSGAQSNTPSPKVLFATHYHELADLADHINGVENIHVAADERDGDVTFLRTVEDGPADRSYGIHVADLAGVPEPVVKRAREVLQRLRDDEAIDVRGSEDETTGESKQVVFDLGSGQFRGQASADGGEGETLDPVAESVLDELRGVDVEGTSPVELLSQVQEWQRRLDD
ncbi:DNA mismatch repair protein MutS [Halorarius litoreus]|uniref:DNA mismatch repair protein MutS n=1 Tax=Halorarius litoreus TaxID=2962676 RepID=UPI0020CD0320|nr:DNA mismatch repair protein MutS [Halorarius litoreus]